MNPGGNFHCYPAQPSNNMAGGGFRGNGNSGAEITGQWSTGFVQECGESVNFFFSGPTTNNFYGLGGSYSLSRAYEVPRNFQREQGEGRRPSGPNAGRELPELLEHSSFFQDHGYDWLNQPDPHKNKHDEDTGPNQSGQEPGYQPGAQNGSHSFGSPTGAMEVSSQGHGPSAFVNPLQANDQVMRSSPSLVPERVSNQPATTTDQRGRGTRGRRVTRSSSSIANNSTF